jgi:hypothetical protein
MSLLHGPFDAAGAFWDPDEHVKRGIRNPTG